MFFLSYQLKNKFKITYALKKVYGKMRKHSAKSSGLQLDFREKDKNV
jgi:hypothetical protein